LKEGWGMTMGDTILGLKFGQNLQKIQKKHLSYFLDL